jgi:CBS domain-containing protein
MSEADLVNPLLRVADVIDPQAPSCSARTPLVGALRRLRDCRWGALPVLDRRRPAGFLTDRNVIAAIYDRPDDWETMTVGELTEPGPPAASPEDTLGVVFKRFHRGGMFVVGPRGELRGIVTWSSVAEGVTQTGLGRLAASCVPGVESPRRPGG